MTTEKSAIAAMFAQMDEQGDDMMGIEFKEKDGVRRAILFASNEGVDLLKIVLAQLDEMMNAALEDTAEGDAPLAPQVGLRFH